MHQCCPISLFNWLVALQANRQAAVAQAAAIDHHGNHSAQPALSDADHAQNNAIKAAAEKAKENPPLDLSGDGAEMFFHIDVSFSEGGLLRRMDVCIISLHHPASRLIFRRFYMLVVGQLWCCASYDTVKIFETLAPFGCSR